MRKVLLVIMVAVLCFAGCQKAAEAGTFQVTTPLETGVTAYWFPTDNTIAGGVSFTALRFKYVDETMPTLSKIAVEIDGNVAKEVNEAKETLYGIGVKMNYDVDMVEKTGFVFKPSLGLTALRSLNGIDEANDILTGFKFAVYGSVVLYKF